MKSPFFAFVGFKMPLVFDLRLSLELAQLIEMGLEERLKTRREPQGNLFDLISVVLSLLFWVGVRSAMNSLAVGFKVNFVRLTLDISCGLNSVGMAEQR